ncbi:MAG: integration host factor subunit alpha [Thermodesulfobacteriota bacterium]
MTLTKVQIAEELQKQLDLSRNESDQLIETTIELIKRTLESGDDVMISGFGKFNVKEKRKRKGRNPATGETMLLDARKVVTFTCSRNLRDLVNDNG